MTETKTDLKTTVRAEAKQVRISPLKVERILQLIRGKNVIEAQTILKFMPHSGARYTEKVLKSAIANAEHNNKLNKEVLTVTRAVANNGIMLKRFRAGGKGSAKRIKKYASHIVIEVTDKTKTVVAAPKTEAKVETKVEAAAKPVKAKKTVTKTTKAKKGDPK